ncbi:MAG: IMP dehydrogenase [Kiritimatiellaeota bacterium]|nr:IMP dehydrogenase [Kiritimatiellota bacterium]
MNKHLDEFMEEFRFEGLTFDDLSLITQYADFLPDDASIETRLTSRIRMNIPFVSAAMDTVTEASMAIAMAKAGGIGVIHKNLSPEQQADHVRRVKHHLNGLIHKPVWFRTGQTLREIVAIREDRKYTFSGFPILDDADRVVGVLTSKDIAFAETHDAKVEEVMTRDIITAPAGTSLEDAYKIMRKFRKGKLPLVDDAGKLAGLYSFTDVQSLVDKNQPLFNRDSKFRLRAAAAVSGGNDYERVERLAETNVDVLVVDSAHGHTKGILDMVAWIAKHYPDIDIIAGNVATAEGAVALRDAGAHAVKVGIGPGSICTTRVVCGVGVPQITAVYAAAKALQNSVPVISDGGIRHSGDVPKALVAGAESVMLGSVLAATEESPGEKIIIEGRNYVIYRGMGSLGAMTSGKGARERYAQSADASTEELVPQGIEGAIPFAGTLRRVLHQFCGGLRSSLGYCGARDIGELRANGRFVRVSAAGVREAHPHDIKITRDAPNYRSC